MNLNFFYQNCIYDLFDICLVIYQNRKLNGSSIEINHSQFFFYELSFDPDFIWQYFIK